MNRQLLVKNLDGFPENQNTYFYRCSIYKADMKLKQ